MAVRQFSRKRRARTVRERRSAVSAATSKVPARRGPPSKIKAGEAGTRILSIPTFAGSGKPVDGREAALTVLEAMHSFAAALLDVESLMWTVNRGHAKGIKNLSTVAQAVLRSAAELKRAVR